MTPRDLARWRRWLAELRQWRHEREREALTRRLVELEAEAAQIKSLLDAGEGE